MHVQKEEYHLLVLPSLNFSNCSTKCYLSSMSFHRGGAVTKELTTVLSVSHLQQEQKNNLICIKYFVISLCICLYNLSEHTLINNYANPELERVQQKQNLARFFFTAFFGSMFFLLHQKEKRDFNKRSAN